MNKLRCKKMEKMKNKPPHHTRSDSYHNPNSSVFRCFCFMLFFNLPSMCTHGIFFLLQQYCNDVNGANGWDVFMNTCELRGPCSTKCNKMEYRHIRTEPPPMLALVPYGW